jgi:hypothetical protein
MRPMLWSINTEIFLRAALNLNTASLAFFSDLMRCSLRLAAVETEQTYVGMRELEKGSGDAHARSDGGHRRGGGEGGRLTAIMSMIMIVPMLISRFTKSLSPSFCWVCVCVCLCVCVCVCVCMRV